MKKIFLCLCAATALFSCEPPIEKVEGEVTALEFAKSSYELEEMASQKLILKVTPEDATNIESIVFSTQYDTIATIDNKGVVYADSFYLGTTEVYATVENSDGTVIKATTTIDVKNIFQLLEIDTWFGHWPQGGLRPNPKFNPDLTYAEVVANIEAGSPDTTKTWSHYADSIGCSFLMILCNGMESDGFGNTSGYESAPVFNVFISYLYRDGTAVNPDEAAYFILNDPEDPEGYVVDPTWLADEHPTAVPGTVRIGTYDEELYKGMFQGTVDSWSGIFNGSQMQHLLAGDMWRPLNTSIITECNINFCMDSETKENYLGNCYLKVEHPVAMGTSVDDITFAHDVYEYNINKENQAPAATRSMGGNIFRQSNINKSLNLAVVSRLAISNPALLK